MRNRFGVVMVLFDLPMDTAEDRRTYHHFRSFLRKNGYMYFHDSVYVKLLRNITGCKTEIDKIKRTPIERGSIVAIPMNISTFEGMIGIRGRPFNMNLFADDIILIEEKDDDDLSFRIF